MLTALGLDFVLTDLLPKQNCCSQMCVQTKVYVSFLVMLGIPDGTQKMFAYCRYRLPDIARSVAVICALVLLRNTAWTGLHLRLEKPTVRLYCGACFQVALLKWREALILLDSCLPWTALRGGPGAIEYFPVR